MTADIRAAAQREAEANIGGVIATTWFIEGAAWCASRLPSEEELATELEKHKLIHASASRRAAFCRCDSSVKAGTDENLAWFETHRAQAVLSMIGEKISGGGKG